MTLIKRDELDSLLRETRKGNHKQVYLFFGERYLCKESADQLQDALLKNSPGTIHAIDGDQEDAGQTLARLMSFSLLPGLQILRVNDSKLFHSKNIGGNLWDKIIVNYEADRKPQAIRHLTALLELAGISPDDGELLAEISKDRWRKLFGFERPEGDLSWADVLLRQATGNKTRKKTAVSDISGKYIASFEKSPPVNNILLLCAETVDKRKKLFTSIMKYGVIVDCSVATGSSMAAQKEQKSVLRELVIKTLDGFDKKIEGQALEMFFERVGFHPVAVVTESEKLALFVDDRDLITCRDLEMMVGRSREDALFELTDAFGKRNTAGTLIILGRLLDNGIHSLAILATMRNYLRKLLLFRSFQLRSTPVYHKGMNPKQFQSHYLPALKESCEWPELLKGHPYALYMSFAKAREFSCSLLKQWLTLLLKAEFRLKGSPLEHKLVLEEMFLAMLRQKSSEEGY